MTKGKSFSSLSCSASSVRGEIMRIKGVTDVNSRVLWKCKVYPIPGNIRASSYRLPSVSSGDGSRTLTDTQIVDAQVPSMKWHSICIEPISYMHTGYSRYADTSLHSYSASSLYVANSGFTFWNFWGFSPPNIIDPRLIESSNVKPADTESQLHLETAPPN